MNDRSALSSRGGTAPRSTPSVPAVEVTGVWKAFDSGRVCVLEGADVTVAPGEMVALWGLSLIHI